jgi:hypothetical protein
MYARDGVEIDPGAMGYWMGSIVGLLAPLVDAVRRYTLTGNKVHANDTPLPVLAPGNGRTKTGRLWVYVRDDRPSASEEPPAVWFAYTPDRRGEHPQQHLAHFAGVLQADAFAGSIIFCISSHDRKLTIGLSQRFIGIESIRCITANEVMSRCAAYFTNERNAASRTFRVRVLLCLSISRCRRKAKTDGSSISIGMGTIDRRADVLNPASPSYGLPETTTSMPIRCGPGAKLYAQDLLGEDVQTETMLTVRRGPPPQISIPFASS